MNRHCPRSAVALLLLQLLLSGVGWTSLDAMSETDPLKSPRGGGEPWGRVPEFHAPSDLATWERQRAGIRRTLQELLGAMPPRPAVPVARLRHREERDGYVVESIEIDNGAGTVLPAYLLLPRGVPPGRRIPAILYCHWHGGQYDVGKEELFRTNAVPEPPGPVLVRRGWAVLAIDAAGFGERNGTGPGGPEDRGAVGETSAAKHELWFGRTLWGSMVRDDQVALDYLCSRPEVDTARIAVTGISMGATRSWWLMALDERPRTAVAVGCLTRYQDLIASRGLRHHGIYYYVPGLLAHFDTEAVVALAAPRPVLFMTGDRDAGSPVSGIRAIESRVRPVYSLYHRETAFVSEIHEGVGHAYTPAMWTRTLGWLSGELGSAVPSRPVRE